MDDRLEPKIHMITFTPEGKLSRIETSSSPVKVEILQQEDDLHEHITSVCFQTEPAAASSRESTRQLCCGTNTSPQSDCDVKSECDSRTNSSSSYEVRKILLNGREIVTVPDVYNVTRMIWNIQGSIQKLMPKLGIKVMRFSSQELMALKQNGAIGLSVKCCSYILWSDFDMIAKKYDETCGTNHRENLLFLSPVNVENPEAKEGIPVESPSFDSSRGQQSSPVFTGPPKPLSGKGDVVEDAQGNHSIRKVKLNSGGLDCSTVPVEFKMDQRSSEICSSNSASSSVNEQGGGVIENSKPSAICSGDAELTHVIGKSSPLGNCSSHLEESDSGQSLSTDEHCSSQPDIEIRTFLLDGRVVVCIPDVHKVTIQLYNQSVQVSTYMRQLKINPQRFSCTLLKQLKAHNVLSARATVCTYISKADAERLLHLYDLSFPESRLHRIRWGRPIQLDDLAVLERGTEPQQEGEKLTGEEGIAQSPTMIPTFETNGEVFVSVPDAHQVIQAISGQSVQLRYNLDKLGIPKHKFPHSHVHQVKTCSILQRPSMCTFITKRDAERLIRFYLDHKNVSHLASIEWLPAVKLGSHVQGSGQVEGSGYTDAVWSAAQPCSSNNLGSRDNNFIYSDSVGTLQSPSPEDEVNSAEAASMRNDDEISLSSNTLLFRDPHRRGKTARSSEALSQCTHHCSTCCTQHLKNAVASPCAGCTASSGCSLAGVGLQHASHSSAPSIAAAPGGLVSTNRSPIASVSSGQTAVWGNNDRGRSRTNGCLVGDKRVFNGTEEERNTADAKKLREENEELLKTVQRKETELKLLHDAYQQRIEEERERRRMAEQKLEELERECAKLRNSRSLT